MELLSAVYKNDGHPYASHFHQRYEIIYITSGSIKISIGGKEYAAGKNDIVLISNLEAHDLLVTKQPYRRYVLSILPEQFDRRMQNIDLVSMLKSRSEQFCHCLHLEADISHLFRRVLEETDGQAFCEEAALALLTEILICVYREHPQNFQFTNLSVKDTLFKIQLYLDAHFCEHIKINEICSKFFVDPYYLSHSFKQFCGFSPKQYLTLVRLNHARKLLQTGGGSVVDIALCSGFSDANNFIRTFKAQFGITPAKYRAQFQKEHF